MHKVYSCDLVTRRAKFGLIGENTTVLQSTEFHQAVTGK